MDAILSSQTTIRAVMVLLLVCGAARADEIRGASTVTAQRPARSAWAEAAEKYHLDAIYLYAIAFQESRRQRADGFMRAWPWTLNSKQTGSLYFDTYEEAVEKLTSLMAEGITNIDIGLMGINWGWNGHRAESAAKLLRPDRNIAVAAELLRELLDKHDGDLEGALARYHNPRAEVGLPYAASVLAIADRLRSAPSVQLALAE